MQVPSLYSLFGWPITPLPNYLLLAAAAVLARRLDFRVFFILFGILFHGAFNNFYNLLPLLYLAQIQNGRTRLSSLLVYYVGGFIVGYAIAQLIVLSAHGTFIQIARWRGARPIDSIENCIRNYNRAISSIENNISVLPNYIFILSMIALCIALPYIKRIFFILRERVWQSQFLLLIVACSTYAQFFPLGLGVAVRTAFPLYFSMLCAPLLLSGKYRLLSSLAMLLIALSFAVPNIDSLRYYHGVTSTYLNELTAITPNPERFKILFLTDAKELSTVENKLSSLHDYKNSINESFTAPMRWVPVARAAHFRSVSVLSGDAAKRALEKLRPFAFTTGKLYDHAFVDDYLILKFNDNFTKK